MQPRKKILFRLMLVIASFVLAVSLGVLVLTPYMYRLHTIRDMERKSDNIAAIAVYSITPAVQFEDLQGLREVFDSLSRDEELVYVVVEDAAGRELAAFRRGGHADTNRADEAGAAASGLILNGTIWSVTRQLESRGETLGRVRLGFSMLPAYAELRRVRLAAAAFSLFIFLMGTLAAYLFSATMTRPLRRVTAVAREIAGGALEKRVEVISSDEVGVLAEAFNAMLDRLVGTMKSLDEARETLEARVAERTAELEERTREAGVLVDTGDAFQVAQSEEETLGVAQNAARRLFRDESGAVYIKRVGQDGLTKAGEWGGEPPAVDSFFPDDCWALRKGVMHSFADPSSDLACPHATRENGEPYAYFCIPLISRGEALGVLHIKCCRPAGTDGRVDGEAARVRDARRKTALGFAQRVSMALANVRLRESLKEQSIKDPLTGLYNRRYLEETLGRELYKAEREKSGLAVMMLDIDHFKKFNDMYGHDAGDAVLQALARLMRSAVRKGDIVCRYGGEEFFIIMPGTGLGTAEERAQLLLERVRCLEVRQGMLTLKGITISIGLALYPEHGSTAEELLLAADAALLEAKKSGRDRLCVRKSN